MNAAKQFDVLIEDNRWMEAFISAPGGATGFAAECRTAAATLERALVGGAALLLADDETLADLNRRFRNIDKPTNVLSFPSAADGEFLGDIAISYETCEREADALGIAFRDHAAHLIVHGLLHLVGYDHEADDDANEMENLETRILAALGVADPYAPEPR
ncbi:MAG: rRNA maturation RNase YbeY [Parvularculaceae bacterium]|nr:rRNA maturation RNase YbeY [Parvularculaceae bacterium]